MAEAPGDPCSEALMAEEGAGLTAEWGAEDGEEAAQQLQAQDQDEGDPSAEPPGQRALLGPQPSAAPELDEDEGFGDWSQKPEQRPQHGEAEGTADGGQPEGTRAEDRSCQHALGDQHGAQLHGAEGLEARLDPEGPEPEPGEAEQEHQKWQQPRTPSPLAMEEETLEPSSPPLSPTTKLADRTESLNRSIKQSNSVKKSQPALPISKIDERLEQYTQAIESAGRMPKLVRQASIELPSMAVASTKSRWETGEVQTQSAAKPPACKDIVAGDMSKKSLWEQRGGAKAAPTVKSTPSGKRYKFVATGHGKYEKVPVDEGAAP